MNVSVKDGISNKELAYVLGTLISDGSFNKDKFGVSLIVKDKDYIDYFYNCFNKIFNVKRKNNIPLKTTDGRWRYSVNQKEINNSLFPVLGDSRTQFWRVPDKIFNASQMIIGSFLSAFFDGDGTVNKGKYLSVHGYSINKQGLVDICKLIKKLKISYCFSKLNRDKNDIYCISINGYNQISKFSKFVKFRIKRKQERIENFLIGFTYHRVMWTTNKTDYIKKNYKRLTDKEIGKTFKVSAVAIQGQRRKLKLKKQGGRKFSWTIKEINFLGSNYLKMTDKDVGKKLNRNPSTIRWVRQKKGLYKKWKSN